MIGVLMLATTLAAQDPNAKPQSEILYEREPVVRAYNNPDGSATYVCTMGHADGGVITTSTMGLDGEATTTMGLFAARDRLPATGATAEFPGTPIGKLRAIPLPSVHPLQKLAAEHGCRYMRIECTIGDLLDLGKAKEPIDVKIGGRKIVTLTDEDRVAIGRMAAQLDMLRRGAKQKPKVIHRGKRRPPR